MENDECGLCLCGKCNIPETMAQMQTQVSELHTLVMGLLDGARNAQQSGGMAGMMARQMFPDLANIGTVQVSVPKG